MNTRTTVPKGNFMSPEDRILPRAFVAAVLICFSARAQVQQAWVTHYNGPGTRIDSAYAMAVDSAGSVYVTGRSYSSDTGYDYATLKYDTDGNQLWAARYNGNSTSDDVAYALAVDDAGNVYVTGGSAG